MCYTNTVAMNDNGNDQAQLTDIYQLLTKQMGW